MWRAWISLTFWPREKRFEVARVRWLSPNAAAGRTLSAYGSRCAISHLPEPRLLDAAHIVMDADEQLGQPVISNGLPLTKIHHAAFDAHLMGSTRISASLTGVLEIHDDPFLELGLKGIAGTLIDRPRRLEDHPDRDRLAIRFEQFRESRIVLRIGLSSR